MSEKLEKEILYLASKVFRIPPARLKGDVDFFLDLGVDSMRAIEIVSALQKKYNLDINLKKVASVRTLDEIVAFVRSAKRRVRKR